MLCQSHQLAQRSFSYVHKEIEYARDRQAMAAETVRYLFPILLDDSSPLERLRDIQSMKVHEEADLDRLAKLIKRDFQRRRRL